MNLFVAMTLNADAALTTHASFCQLGPNTPDFEASNPKPSETLTPLTRDPRPEALIYRR